jgi:hypothetical protein
MHDNHHWGIGFGSRVFAKKQFHAVKMQKQNLREVRKAVFWQPQRMPTGRLFVSNDRWTLAFLKTPWIGVIKKPGVTRAFFKPA